jgi:MFS transporter, DHA1 family, multidrug resistance protein
MPRATAAADEESRHYPYWRRNRWVFPFANVLCGFGFSLAWPFVPLMVRGLGVRENLETWVGYMLLAFYLVSTATSPVWGGVAEHYGRKPMVLRAMLGMGFTMMLVPLAPTPLWFAAALMLVAVFNGFTPAGISLLVANTPPQRIGSAVSLAQTGGQVGHALGPAAGAALAALIDQQHALYWISAGLMTSGGILVALLVREVKQVTAGPWRPRLVGSLRELLEVPRVAPLFLLAFMFSIMWHGSVTNISVFVLQLLEAQPVEAGVTTGVAATWIGAAATAMALSTMIALPLWGRVIDRIGPARVLAIGAAATVITHLPLLVLQTPLQLVLARVAFGLTSAGMQTAIFQLLRMHSPAGMDARALSYATAFQFLAMGVAPFIAGLVGPALGLRAYFAISTALMIGALAMWLRAGKKK